MQFVPFPKGEFEKLFPIFSAMNYYDIFVDSTMSRFVAFRDDPTIDCVYFCIGQLKPETIENRKIGCGKKKSAKYLDLSKDFFYLSDAFPEKNPEFQLPTFRIYGGDWSTDNMFLKKLKVRKHEARIIYSLRDSPSTPITKDISVPTNGLTPTEENRESATTMEETVVSRKKKLKKQPEYTVDKGIIKDWVMEDSVPPATASDVVTIIEPEQEAKPRLSEDNDEPEYIPVRARREYVPMPEDEFDDILMRYDFGPIRKIEIDFDLAITVIKPRRLTPKELLQKKGNKPQTRFEIEFGQLFIENDYSFNFLHVGEKEDVAFFVFDSEYNKANYPDGMIELPKNKAKEVTTSKYQTKSLARAGKMKWYFSSRNAIEKLIDTFHLSIDHRPEARTSYKFDVEAIPITKKQTGKTEEAKEIKMFKLSNPIKFDKQKSEQPDVAEN
jgi:hypothetical protein